MLIESDSCLCVCCWIDCPRFCLHTTILLFLSHMQLPGKKDLFIEADLMSPLDRIANVSTLKVNIISWYPSHLWFWRTLEKTLLYQCPLQTFCLVFFVAATWSRQTLQSGIQTCYKHFRPVSHEPFILITLHSYYTNTHLMWQRVITLL